MRRIRTERTRAGLTLRELSDRAGISITTLSAVERGVQKPQPVTIKRIADALGVDVDLFLEEAEEVPLLASTPGSK